MSTNAKKHGNASTVEIEVYRQNNCVILTVEDNGAGFDPQSIRHFTMDSGFGLTNIKDKIEQYGGKMKIRSAPTGNGSLFLFDIPMERFADGH
ncbi:MAG: GHKL domain-containing protein [Calditrichaeota bacterium]|nr:GHKL domain-containing protein [Calditrichota bacterium]